MDIRTLNYDVNVNSGKFKQQLQAVEQDANQSAKGIMAAFKQLADLLDVKKMFHDGIGAARSFSKELANIKSVAGELNKNTLAREISNVNAALGDSAQIANAVYFAYSAGVRGTEKELVKFTETIVGLAKTIGTDISPMMDAAVTMMDAYGLSVKDADMLSDWFYVTVKAGKTTGPELANALGMIASTAATAKIPIDQLGAAIATLTTTMPTAQAITSLNQTILAFINPTQEAQQVAASLGVELSAGALASKGLAGALAEINAKAGDNVTALTAMFTSVDAFKAAASLAGTQAQTFQNNVTEFANKSGTAAQGLKEQLDSFDSRLNGLEVSLSKFLRVVTEVIYNVVSFGGALNGVFDSINKGSIGTVETLAKITALNIGMAALYKTARVLGGLQGVFSWARAKVGYESTDAFSARQAAEAEQAKVLRKQKTDAERTLSENRRHLNEVSNARTSARAVMESENAKMSAAARRYRAAQMYDERARLSYSLQHGSLNGYNPDTELATANKEYGDTKKSLSRSTKELNRYNREVGAATQKLTTSNAAVMTATASLNAHNKVVADGTVKVGLLKGAWNGLKAAFLSNPLGWTMLAVSAAISVVMVVMDRARQKAEALAEAAQKTHDEAMRVYDTGKADQQRDVEKIKRLQELSLKQHKTNSEIAEAKRLASELSGKYGDIGLKVNDVTGEISGLADAISDVMDKMKEWKRMQLEEAIKPLQEQYDKRKQEIATGWIAEKILDLSAKNAFISPHPVTANLNFTKSVQDEFNRSTAKADYDNFLNGDLPIGHELTTKIVNDEALNNLSAQLKPLLEEYKSLFGAGDKTEELPLVIAARKTIAGAEQALLDVSIDKEKKELDEIEAQWIKFVEDKKILTSYYANSSNMTTKDKQKEFENLAKLYKDTEQKKEMDKLAVQAKYAELRTTAAMELQKTKAEQNEQRRKIAMSNAEASVWQDGFLSNQEKADLKHLEIMHEEQRMLEAKAQLQNAQNEPAMLGARAAIAAAQSRMAQMRADFAQILNGSHDPRRNDAAFSAQVLNILGGDTMSVQDRIAKASEESARYLKELYYIQDDNNVIVLR